MTTDPELEAMTASLSAIEPLEQPARERVLRWLADRLNVAVPSTAQARSVKPGEKPEEEPQPGDLSPTDISSQELREYVDEKSPQTHEERYAVIAKFLKDVHGAMVLDPELMVKCYRIIGKKAPSKPRQIFSNAKQRHNWFDNAPGQGNWRLTLTGEEDVEYEMPRKVAQ